ncbi:hypothetical protein [Hymenobacter rigui]|uniref:Uncharacterized protein n=1 Tax=Hymenobacter rigui TaxID=334424 RepID=A0A428KTU4_9BACT|nr:hypothetical protein [Hymenobacter rigui]RSK49992.1 hypothetical protein EI291_04905 [Hymenobacter rigui]
MPTITLASPVRFQYANRVAASLLLLSNCYFLTLGFLTIRSGGGPMGYGLLVLPFLLAAYSFLMPAALAFTRKWRGSLPLFVLNLIGLLYSMCLLYFLLFASGLQ